MPAEPNRPTTPPTTPATARPAATRPGLSRPGATRTVTTRTTGSPATAPARPTPTVVTPPGKPPVAPVSPPRAPSDRRRDIQGLRALAVIAVICHHVIGTPTGGFAGVDVFFVISGFLITGILLREHDSTGRISLRSFYANRMRRILPAAVTVLAVTAALGYVLFNQARALSTAWDAVSSLFFVANWRFTAVGTDYFSASAPASAVQHYWSLSVEEQFYLAWPVLLIGVLALVARRTRGGGRRAVAVLAGGIVLVSFGYALWETTTSPTVAYFSTFSRAWELGVGAVLAAAVPVLSRMPAALRVILGWAGLAGIVVAFVVLDDALPFPGPWAALPVAATALVIAAGVGGTQRHLVPLTNPVSVFLGNISYSLYLWHFPVLIFLGLLLPGDSVTSTLLILGATLVLSVVSYFLIEQPLHRSPWLRGGRPAADRRLTWSSWRAANSTQFILSSTALFVIVVVIAVSVQVSDRPMGSASSEPVPAYTQPDVDPAVALQADLAAAAAATAWPDDLSPSLDDVMRTTSNTNPARACFDVGNTPSVDRCTWGDSDAPNRMYLVGDSEALSYAPAFKAMAEASAGQWQITTIGLYGCRFTAVTVANEGAGVMDACPQRKSDVAAAIVADAPQLVVVANAFALGQDTNRSPLSVTALVDSAATEAASYNAAGRIVYLAAPPLGAELGQCYSAVSSPQDCTGTVGQTWREFAAATAASAAATGDHFIDSLPFSCAADRCPAFAGTVPTKYDTVHLTTAYAERISPAIRYTLGSLGLM